MSSPRRRLGACRLGGHDGEAAGLNLWRSAVIAALTVASVIAVAACTANPGSSQNTIKPTSLDLSSAKALANSLAQFAAKDDVSASRPASVKYQTIEYSTAVGNAGSPGAFSAFVTLKRNVTVFSSSAATVATAQAHPLTFTSASDRHLWTVAGSPALEPDDVNQTISVPSGQFSFILQGTPMTYRQVAQLPDTAAALYAQVASHLHGFAESNSAAVMLKQLAYLVAVGPLLPASRSAAWRAIADLRGLHLCGGGTDLAGRRGVGLCADVAGQQTNILVSEKTGAILAIEERLVSPSQFYPLVPAGSLILSITVLSS